MTKISVSDVTMKQSGKQAGFSLSFREKIELGKLLDKLGTSVIELSPIENVKIDSLLIKSVASAVKESTIAVTVGLDKSKIEIAAKALAEAAHKRLQVTAPVSAVQMEYLAGKKPAAMLEAIADMVKACKAACPEVEFIADDATRADTAFLYDAIRTAITAGADIVTLCDTAGAMLPDDMMSFINEVYANVSELRNVKLGISCSNELAMADACAIAAIRCGAVEIKAAAYPINTVSVESVAKLLAAKGGSMDASCGIRTTQMRRLLEQIRWMCRTDRSDSSPFDNGVQGGSEFTMTVHDDMSAVAAAVAKLGYELNEEDISRVFEAFTRVASKKETVSAKELDAIIASAAMQVPPTYKLESYVINTGNTISATAHMKIQKAGVTMEGISLGDGPVDASFLAIEQIAGHHYELDDFQIQAVTEGREAMGESVVKLRSNGKLFSGRGISTDVLGAAIHAYINALNKIAYEESVG